MVQCSYCALVPGSKPEIAAFLLVRFRIAKPLRIADCGERRLLGVAPLCLRSSPALPGFTRLDSPRVPFITCILHCLLLLLSLTVIYRRPLFKASPNHQTNFIRIFDPQIPSLESLNRSLIRKHDCRRLEARRALPNIQTHLHRPRLG